MLITNYPIHIEWICVAEHVGNSNNNNSNHPIDIEWLCDVGHVDSTNYPIHIMWLCVAGHADNYLSNPLHVIMCCRAY